MENPTTFQKIMGFVNKAGNMVMLNLLFLVSCIPVVTIGPAWKGLYSAVRYSIRRESWFEGYKAGFKHKFLRTAVGFSFGLAALGYSGYQFIWALLETVRLPGWDMALPLLIHGLFFLTALTVTTAMVPTGLYFESDVNTWLMNAWDLLLHAPLQVIAAGVLMWAPVVILLFFPGYGYMALIVFLAIYFVLTAVVNTALLKNPLIRILNRIRAEAGEETAP